MARGSGPFQKLRNSLEIKVYPSTPLALRRAQGDPEFIEWVRMLVFASASGLAGKNRMKVVLLSDIKDLGKRWDVCDISDGYARNVLIPKGLAVPATANALQRVRNVQEKNTQAAAKSLKASQNIASSIDGYELTLKARASEKGELYAAITPHRIAEAFAEEKLTVPVKAIRIATPIKSLGEHSITVALDHGIETTTKVIVEAEPE